MPEENPKIKKIKKAVITATCYYDVMSLSLEVASLPGYLSEPSRRCNRAPS